MLFSIIVPSFNQGKYIQRTLQNLIELKKHALSEKINVEVLLYDSESGDDVQKVISGYSSQLDFVEIKKDKGQYDAINKGIQKCQGDYWTWLNTDDYLDISGFIKLAKFVRQNPEWDYVYGNIDYMDDSDKLIFTVKSTPLVLEKLIQTNPGIYQPGSFFKNSFTDSIGLLKPYRCCFDYEYILRCLKNNARVYQSDFTVAKFRYYNESKTGSLIPIFVKEQLEISREYGRKALSYLTFISNMRLLKHKLFPKG